MRTLKKIEDVLLRFTRNYEGIDGEVEEEGGERPCNQTGHNWKPAYSPDYYARSEVWKDNILKIEKTTHEECSKCGGYRKHNEWIGKVKADKETDELTVIQ